MVDVEVVVWVVEVDVVVMDVEVEVEVDVLELVEEDVEVVVSYLCPNQAVENFLYLTSCPV